MKKNVILLIFSIHFLFGNNPQELFLQGQQCYQEKKFEKALEIFNTIEPKNDSVWFCLGNCYNELNQPIQAIVALKKAYRNCFQLSRLKLLQEYIEKTNNKLSLPSKKSFMTKIIDFIDLYSRIIPLWWWQIIFLVCWFMVIGAGIWLIQKKQYILIASLIFFCIPSGFVLSIRYYTLSHVRCIAIKPSAMCLSTDTRLISEESIIPGQELVLLQKKDEWCKIINDTNCVGWVPSDVITVL